MEAIKNAVEVGLGVAFVSRSAVEKEVALGRLAVLTVRGVPLRRTLLCVTDPVRYCSQAVRAFIQEMFGLTIATSASGCFLPGQARAAGWSVCFRSSADHQCGHLAQVRFWRCCHKAVHCRLTCCPNAERICSAERYLWWQTQYCTEFSLTGS